MIIWKKFLSIKLKHSLRIVFENNVSKKVLIISTSLRNNANSEILAKETEQGALQAGYDVE